MKLKKTIVVYLVFIASISSIASARIWTDTSGRKIEAETVSMDEESVTVLLKGKEVIIPRSKLSEADQKYCEEWLEKQRNADNADPKKEDKKDEKGAKPAGNGQLEFDGKPLIAGGKVNVYNYDYSPGGLKSVSKALKNGETGYRIGISVPNGFDPTKPHRVFIANTAQNNPKQTEQGNTAMAGFFSKQCAQKGWVCIAYDSNLGRPTHNLDLISAMAKLNEVWPQFKQWKFVSGGFSGGGKAAFWPAAYMLKNEYQLTGLFLANTNQDFSELARKEYDIKKSDYKNVSVFWGTGKWDEIATKATGEEMKKSLEKNGMKQVRVEFHEGKHSLFHPQFIEALEWFEQQDK